MTVNTEIIQVIGLGVSQSASLSAAALLALQHADVVIGSTRQLAVVEDLLAARQVRCLFPKLAELSQCLAQYQQQSIVMLASGDPLYYGIGRWLLQHFPREKLVFHPGISSIQAACHAVGLALQDVKVLSLHGRPLEKIRTGLKAQQPLVVLTDKNSQPDKLAQACLDAGFADSSLWVCECLGYQQANVRQFSARQLLTDRTLSFDPLHVVIIEPKGVGGVLPEFPGITDDAFVTDSTAAGKGMLTKREVRLMILSLIQAANGDIIWDIGAGCGSVAIELAYWQTQAKVYAVEHHQTRLACLAENRLRFGVTDNLSIVAGRAPEQMCSLPQANKVFIGGSDGQLADILAVAWQQLPEHGLLVASAVTENTKTQLHHFAQSLADEQVETLQLAVSKGSQLAGQLLYKPNLPVTLYKFIKISSV